MNPKLFVLALIGWILFTLFPEQSCAERPNIILIMADDLGRDCLGCYGGESYQTPNIDALAAQGTRFECCYATPMCSPTRVMLMTGRYNFRNYTTWARMDFSEPTMARALKAAGYETAIFGKWHLGGWNAAPYGPTQVGFDQFATFDYEQVVREGGQVGNQFWLTKVWENGKNFRLEGYGPTFYRQHALKFIREHAEPEAKPFFLYYPLVHAHRPFVPTDHVEAPLAERTVRNGELKHFPGMIEYIDFTVGEVLKVLHETGQREKTIVLFTADNGTDAVGEAKELLNKFQGELVRGGKYHPSELGANVPLIVSGPGVKRGQLLSKPVDFTDLFPTLCQFADAEIPSVADGESLVPALMQGDETCHDGLAATWGVYERSSRKYKDPRQYQAELIHIVRDERWKLQSNGVVYDIQNDPFEENPLREAQIEKLPERLKLRLKNLRASSSNLW